MSFASARTPARKSSERNDVLRVVKVWLAACLMVGMMGSAAHALSWQERHGTVRFQSLLNPDWTTQENELTIRSASRKFSGISAATMLCIARRESGDALNEDAVNSFSGTSGLFQHMPQYWPGRVAAYNRQVAGRRPWLEVGGGIFESRSQALVSAWMMKSSLDPWGGYCG